MPTRSGLDRVSRRRGRARGDRRPAGRADDHRPRRVPRGQRHLGPCGRRRGAPHHGRAAEDASASGPGRLRASPATSSRSSSRAKRHSEHAAARRQDPHVARRAVRGRRQQRSPLGASIGAALYPINAETGEFLFRAADSALSKAKAMGRNALAVFDTEMKQRMQRSAALERDLRQALGRNEFVVFYQPQLELASGRLRGYEALVRWERPGEGILSPRDFLAVAEETGLIRPIGEWVLRKACQDAASWLDAGTVAVNFSAGAVPLAGNRQDDRQGARRRPGSRRAPRDRGAGEPVPAACARRDGNADARQGARRARRDGRFRRRTIPASPRLRISPSTRSRSTAASSASSPRMPTSRPSSRPSSRSAARSASTSPPRAWRRASR